MVGKQTAPAPFHTCTNQSLRSDLITCYLLHKEQNHSLAHEVRKMAEVGGYSWR